MIFRGNSARLLEVQLRDLSRAYGHIWVNAERTRLILDTIKLPPGYNYSSTSVLLRLPADYPSSPPGIGSSQVFVSPHLRFRGNRLRDVHDDKIPDFPTWGFGPWAWWCYESIEWDPCRDDLIKFFEMVRADLTNPPIR